MATLNLSIEIDNDTFTKLIKDNITSLTPEELKPILLSAFAKAIEVDGLFVNSTGYYGNKEPSQLTKDIFKNINWSQYYSDIGENVAKFLRENYQKIILNLIAESFSQMLWRDENRYEILFQIRQQILQDLNMENK